MATIKSNFSPISSSIVINKPVAAVWGFLQKPGNWTIWWAAMTGISPDWSTGATLVWAQGGSSTLIKFKPPKIRLFGPAVLMVLAGPSIQMSISLDGINGGTLVKLEEKPIGGASWTDGGFSRLYPINSALEKLKSHVEQL